LSQYKLFFKFLFYKIPFSFVTNTKQNKSLNIFLSHNSVFYLFTHLKLSSVLYLSQLSDIFAYELPYKTLSSTLTSQNQSSVVVYNIHSFLNQVRIYIYSYNFAHDGDLSADSVTELFSSANWLEREVAELNGILFLGKNDIRNLMLQYGDSSKPFRKSFPSIGLKELMYNPTVDSVVQNPISMQL
jgi:NADH-quinone oxidoreductase subunit C